MPQTRSPEKLVAWQLCGELSDLVFQITETGPAAKSLSFRNQVRASASAPAPLIAEGFGRFTPREFAHYLRMAVGSLMETRTHLGRGVRQKLISADQHATASRLCERALDITKKLLASKNRQIERETEKKRRSSNRLAAPAATPRIFTFTVAELLARRTKP